MRAIFIALAAAALPAAAQPPARMTPAQVTALPHSEPYIRGHHEPVAPGTPAWAKVEAFIVENALN
jgi:hypothetical protein